MFDFFKYKVIKNKILEYKNLTSDLGLMIDARDTRIADLEKENCELRSKIQALEMILKG